MLLTKPNKEISGIDHKPEWIDQVLVMTSPLFISMHVIGPTLLQVNEIVGLQLLTPLGFGLIRPTLTYESGIVAFGYEMYFTDTIECEYK